MALTDNLVWFFDCEEASGDLIDLHSTHDLTESAGAAASATGKVGNCREFDGSDLFFGDYSSDSAFAMPSSGWTLAFWLLPDDKGTSSNFVFEWDLSGTNLLQVYVNGTGNSRRLSVTMRDSFNTLKASVLSEESMSISVWNHVAIVVDSTDLSVYVNAVLDPFDVDSYSGGLFGGNCDVYLGGFGSANYDGKIDELGLWDTALTGSDISDLYNGGAGIAYPFIASAGGAQAVWL